MSMLTQRAKTQLRISHNLLDSEIDSNIATARAELIRLGVSEPKAQSDDALIDDAVLAFVMYKMADRDNEKRFEAWQYQADCLRKSSAYNGAQNV